MKKIGLKFIFNDGHIFQHNSFESFLCLTRSPFRERCVPPPHLINLSADRIRLGRNYLSCLTDFSLKNYEEEFGKINDQLLFHVHYLFLGYRIR